MRIRLGDADRERLGCPEWLIEDELALSIVEADLLQRAGIEPDDVVAHIAGAPKLAGDGTQLTTDDGYAIRSISMLGWRIRVWLALRRAGVRIPFDELDFSLLDMVREVHGPAVDEGKDDAETAPSPTSEPNTTPGSDSSSI